MLPFPAIVRAGQAELERHIAHIFAVGDHFSHQPEVFPSLDPAQINRLCVTQPLRERVARFVSRRLFPSFSMQGNHVGKTVELWDED